MNDADKPFKAAGALHLTNFLTVVKNTILIRHHYTPGFRRG
ncbi:hypothetical protein FHR20_001267 [Sphingomonas leidyi]|uniref:Uncharacterized protein n=1 Tax=Sphingomonas leidyi TaxID=68569 RepID=A0A7X5UZ28_9SPHN|nr:hypothetical protein [Sphingomonas leidyi]